MESVGLTSAPVRSMGGIRVLPSAIVTEVDPADVAAFIIPGGDRWENSPVEPEIERLLNVWMRGAFRSRRSARPPWRSLDSGSCEGGATRATVWRIFVHTFLAMPRRHTTWTFRLCGIVGSSPPVVWATSSLRESSSKN